MAAATVSLTEVASFAGAMGSLGLGGVGYALVNPATGRAVLLLFPQTRRATAMGIKQSGVPLGGLAAAAVGALAVVLGWQGVLWLVAAVTIVLAATCFFLPDEGGHGDAISARRALADLGKVLRNRNLTLLIILGGGYNMAQSAFFAYLTLFLREVAQASLPVASMCFGLAQGAAVVGRVSWGVVSDRLFGGRRKIVIVLIGLTGAAALSAMPAAGLGPVLAVGAPAGDCLRTDDRRLWRSLTDGGCGGRRQAAGRSRHRLSPVFRLGQPNGGPAGVRRRGGLERSLRDRLAHLCRPAFAEHPSHC